MLWDIIMYFYIRYVFGGVVQYDGVISSYHGFLSYQNGVTSTTQNIRIPFFDISIPIGNYLSFIATILTMVVILFLSWKLIKAIFNICARVI